ncbi:MAG: hypothetical protein RI885_149, partial [Actinomycetota bacterium]
MTENTENPNDVSRTGDSADPEAAPTAPVAAPSTTPSTT